MDAEMKLPLLYKDRRLEGDTPLRQTQLVELHLLEVFKEICNRHDIKFWVGGGTLLGAMRHQGFIPWDDDLDVVILKKDYQRFIAVAKKELPDDVYLDLPNQSDAYRQENQIARLRDNYSTAIIRHNKRLLINDHHGINIDIFYWEPCGNKSSFAAKVLHSFVSNRGLARRACYDRVTLTNLSKKWILFGWTFLAWILWRFLETLCPHKKYLSPTNFYTAWKEWHPYESFVRDDIPTRMAEFEGIQVPIPYDAEEHLERLYHDWRKLPPEDRRYGYYGVLLPFTPCMHPAAMRYPYKDKPYVSCGGTLVDDQLRGYHD